MSSTSGKGFGYRDLARRSLFGKMPPILMVNLTRIWYCQVRGIPIKIKSRFELRKGCCYCSCGSCGACTCSYAGACCRTKPSSCIGGRGGRGVSKEEEEKPVPFNADLENGGARSYGMQKVQDNGYGGTKDWSTIYMVRGGKVSCVRLEKRGVRISQWHRCQLIK